MEVDKEGAIEPSEVNKHPKVIKGWLVFFLTGGFEVRVNGGCFFFVEAQAELSKLDVLVCGQCHSVFHFIEQFQEHREPGNCSGQSTIRENNVVR